MDYSYLIPKSRIKRALNSQFFVIYSFSFCTPNCVFDGVHHLNKWTFTKQLFIISTWMS